MMGKWQILGAGAVDDAGVVGTARGVVDWRELGVDPASTAAWRQVFDESNPGYRRLDPLSRAVALAAEAADPCSLLTEETRHETALILASAYGCLEADLRFARGLDSAAGLEPAVFAYTLSSTCLGELAIRYGLRGPCQAFGVAPGGEAEGLDEAFRILDAGEAAAAVVCLGDGLTGEVSIEVAPRPASGMLALIVGPARGSRGALDVVQERPVMVAETIAALRQMIRSDGP